MLIALLALLWGAASCAAGLFTELTEALEAARQGNASSYQEALLFKNNDAINSARLNGWISDQHYQKAQASYARLNESIACGAAKDAGAGFRVQTASSATYKPGTDSDYITEIRNPEQVKQMQQSYNRRMAAEYERMSRAARQTSVTPEQFRDYGEEMRDFTQKKQKMMKEMRANPECLANPEFRAEYQKLMAQEQKYISRIESATDTLRKQEGLTKAAFDPGAPMYEVFPDADGKLVMKRARRSDSPAFIDPRVASRELQMGQNASIAKRGSLRSPDNFGTNSMDRALTDYAETMAEASRRNPAFAAPAAEDIADLTHTLPASAKGELLDRLRRTQGSDFTEKVAAAPSEDLDAPGVLDDF